MALRVELPAAWQAVGLDHDGGTDLAAFREPVPGEDFTPNLTLVTRRARVDVPVVALANRAVGQAARSGASIAVFTRRDWGSGATALVLCGFRVRTLATSDDPEQRLVRFHLHAGLPEGPAGWHDVAQLELACAEHQRALVEDEFTAIVRSVAVDD